MEWLQTILDGGTAPFITALILGLMTAISPCPLATNVAAMGYIAKDLEQPHMALSRGIIYCFGRMLSYTALGIVLIAIIRSGSTAFGVQSFVAGWGEKLIGPLMLLVGLFMLFGHRLRLKGFGYSGDGRRIASKGGWGALALGALFAMAFCPTSAVFYFGMLIPMSATASSGWLLPVVFAIATALPVLVVAWVLAYSMQSIGKVMGKISVFQRWFNRIVALLFIGVGIYYSIMTFV